MTQVIRVAPTTHMRGLARRERLGPESPARGTRTAARARPQASCDLTTILTI